MKNGSAIFELPTLAVTASCLPEAWEKAVLAVWDNGLTIKTQYDKPGDPPSKDATVMITVENPFAEPRIHKNFPGGPEELESYRQEVLDGIHDHWIDPAAGKWTYTYHERLFAYSPVENLRDANTPKPFKRVNQVDYIIDALAECSHTRRAQAITWMPTADPQTEDPPCLQRIWCRLVEQPDGAYSLNMNTHWRSRDLYKAWFMNAYALTDMQRRIAEKIAKKIGKLVRVGRYVDISDSLHIYGSYFRDAAVERAANRLDLHAEARRHQVNRCPPG
ncbi:MAG TPA: thymidylate synthase, partial [Anaerohalosphaeraceae bacterium]|nr:thymidylate synthase [Anaerohalosphaeraceae bacterium]